MSIEHPSVGLASLAQFYMYMCLSYVKLTAKAELRSPRACSKSFWAVKTDLCTRVIDFDYALEQLHHDEKETFT